ncbi:hypothetical protein [Micromonospora sp. NPDC051006]|uniref:hypothetical protein n=1 Tax=Micromonospora sp. NPDC051006 TaxID=3364283 RepID=UPI003796655A
MIRQGRRPQQQHRPTRLDYLAGITGAVAAMASLITAAAGLLTALAMVRGR